MLVDKDELESLFVDFDDCLSKEAKFAKQCDKLECCLQAKIYDQDKLIDLTIQDDNATYHDDEVQSLLNSGDSFSDMWLKWHKEHDGFDDNFKQIIDYMIANGVFISQS